MLAWRFYGLTIAALVHRGINTNESGLKRFGLRYLTSEAGTVAVNTGFAEGTLLTTAGRILADDIAHLSDVAAQEPRDAEHLAGNLREIYQAIFLIDLINYQVDDVRADAPRLLQSILDLRTQVRSQISDWNARGLMTHDVQSALRDCFRASRYASELIGEVLLNHPRLGPEELPFAGFAGGEHYVRRPSAWKGRALEFHPGDVILQRGMVHNSAAIARIGDVDSQFSHVGIVARDQKGELVVVEALIEVGSIITPLTVNLSHQIGRAILFRHRDGALAARAAEQIHERIAKSREPTGQPILYDFSMELEGYKELFCSKLIGLAYELGSDGKVNMPPFPTLLNMKNRDFPRRIGVTAHKTFAPGDLELDPDFDVVAEWCDFRVTSNMRIKDMIMTKLFEWMEVHGYKFRPDLTVRLIALGGRLSSRLPKRAQKFVASFTGGVVPPNMTGSAIGAVAMLHKTAEPIYKELELLEAESIRNSGRQLHPRQVLDILEQIRQRSGNRIGYLKR
jgi:hypothetical protein